MESNKGWKNPSLIAAEKQNVFWQPRIKDRGFFCKILIEPASSLHKKATLMQVTKKFSTTRSREIKDHPLKE